MTPLPDTRIPFDGPQSGITVRQRPNFAAWLRGRGMVRYDSHQVARDPGARWWIMRGSDGWVRATEVRRPGYCPVPYMRKKLARAGITVVEAYVMRFKKVPHDI